MPTVKNGQALKNELLRLISENIGQKTADLYKDFCDTQTPDVAMKSVEGLLVEFIGQERTAREFQEVRRKFKMTSKATV